MLTGERHLAQDIVQEVMGRAHVRWRKIGPLVDGRHCTIEFDEFAVDFGFANVSDDELARIVAGMHPATWDDPSTWYDIEDALPDG